jgi:hypothetical protein
MQTYARQGGTSTIFINDDGLRLLSTPDRDERLAYYANHNIGWVARPKHSDAPDGFRRAGRFKKASNMNYGLELSLKAERHLETLVANAGAGLNPSNTTPTLAELAAGFPHGLPSAGLGAHRMSVSSNVDTRSFSGAGRYGLQYQNREGDDMGAIASWRENAWGFSGSGGGGTDTPSVEDLEERALGLAIEEMYEESGRRFRPWAANGKATRLGEYVLIVDSDTIVPEVRRAAAARFQY